MRVALYDKQSGLLQVGGREILDSWRKDPQQLIWLDLDGSQQAEEKQLLHDTFQIHPLAVSDATNSRHPPKYEIFDDYTFILLKGLSDHSENLEYSTLQLAMLCGGNFLVTRHSANSPSIDLVWKNYQENPGLFAEGTGVIVLGISRTLVNRFTNLILNLEPRLDMLEDQMMDNPNDNILTELIGYKGNLTKLRRIFSYHRRIFQELQEASTPGIPDELTHIINDVYEHQERVSSLTQLYYELASDLIDGYISLASHRLNQIMKVLTIITAIFVPITFIAGIYGMNFEYMPELHSKSGYFIALGTMATIVLALMIVFKRNKWL
jgi:magnesium transporter